MLVWVSSFVVTRWKKNKQQKKKKKKKNQLLSSWVVNIHLLTGIRKTCQDVKRKNRYWLIFSGKNAILQNCHSITKSQSFYFLIFTICRSIIPGLTPCSCSMHGIYVSSLLKYPSTHYLTLAILALFHLCYTQLAFYVNLHRAVIGPSATLTGRWRPDIDLRRMLTGIYHIPYSLQLKQRDVRTLHFKTDFQSIAVFN